MNSIRLQHVQYMPKQLSPGILYVSIDYAVAGHLCACGCGNKVITPLMPAKWKFTERNGRPSLDPSIGNWQLPCKSHYLIVDGNIHWAEGWSKAEIEAGRLEERKRLNAYYTSREPERSLWSRIEVWLRQLFR